MWNGKIVVTISSNDLVLTLQTLAGGTPSSSDPVYIKVKGTVRTVTAATTCTLADATNWYNAGSAELAAKEIDYAVCAIWDSNSSVIAISPDRIFHGRVVSDFSATTTDEKHLFGYSGFTSTDDVVVIGRIAATLSAGAGYTWTSTSQSAPTSVNTIQRPIFETRMLTWAPTTTGFSANPTVTSRYKVVSDQLYIDVNTTAVGTSNATTFTQTLPFKALNIVGGTIFTTHDNTANAPTGVFFTAAGSAILSLFKSAGAAWTAAGTKAASYNGWLWI
jgi:hypothetical protein